MNLSGWPQMAIAAGVMVFVVRPLGASLARHAQARRGMSPAQKERLTAAFEALGPERVARGVTATGHDWSDCFVAVAIYDGPEARWRAVRKYGWTSHERLFGLVIGTSPDVIGELVRVWDRSETTLRTLAVEWLEQGRVSGARAARELVAAERR